MKKENSNGSALVFALMVMFIILTAALGAASVSMVEQRNSSATGKSTQAFQVADSAVEIVLKKAALDPAGTKLSTLVSDFGGGTCNGGVISGDINGRQVDLSFEYASNQPIFSCDITLAEVAKVKAVGRFSDTTRAISAAVAAGTLSWLPLSGTISFFNGWQTWPAAPSVAKYTKDSRTGIVYLKGLIRNANVATNVDSPSLTEILTLPAGFIPAVEKIFTVPCNSTGIYATTTTSCRVDITTDGKMVLWTSAYWFSLDGIFFSTN
jgi:hypothetical protein